LSNKTRKVKEFEYNENYGMIPLDYGERLKWMVSKYNVSGQKFNEILNMRDSMINSLRYHEYNIILYEIPEGAVRPKFRIVNRGNFANAAMENSSFVHVYSPHAMEDSMYMKRLTDTELQEVAFMQNKLMCTPCIVTYNVYHKMPSNYNTTEIFMAEMGIDRDIKKPDWDNLAKKYSDMSNETIWLDDSFVITGTVNKYYSILPRIEINLRYLNMLYNKKQYDYVTKRKDFISNDLSVGYFRMED
jgi:Holliday junction resolvase RusA-like endonuclease